MAVTETTTVSWGSRLGSSLKGVLVGLGLFIAGFEAANWTVQAVPETRGTCRLECADGELRFVVVPNGTAIFIR